MKKITFVITTIWATLYQRHHQLAYRFKQDGYEVRVVDVSSVAVRMLEERLHKRLYERQLSIPDKMYTFTYAIPKKFAQHIGFLWKRGEESLSKFMQDLSGKAFTDDSILWVQGVSIFYNPEVLKRLPKTLFISDIEDDYKYFFKEELREHVQEIESEIARSADLVFTTAQSLHERLKLYNPKAYVITNGVDENFIRVAENEDLQRPADMPKDVVIGYHGAIADWIDFDLLHALAKELDSVKIVLIGKLLVFLDRERFKKLTSLPNVVYLGEKPYDQLPYYISHFDVGIIPFSISTLTRAVHPNKLYEYLACGKPVVSTMLPEVTRYAKKGVLEVTDDHTAFIESVRRMIEVGDDEELVRQRIELAKNNTWQSKYEKIKVMIQEELNTKGIKQ